MEDFIVEALSDLVRTPSVNPLFAAGDASIAGESRAVAVVEGHLKRLGLETWTVEGSEPGRESIVGCLRGSGGGRSLMFNGHLDTVGVEGLRGPVRGVPRRRPSLRSGLLRHEGWLRRRARSGRAAGQRERSPRRRHLDLRGGGRGGGEHRSASRRTAISDGWRGGCRADRAGARFRPQGLRVAHGHDGRAGVSRQPAGPRGGREPPDGYRLEGRGPAGKRAQGYEGSAPRPSLTACWGDEGRSRALDLLTRM